MCLVLWCKTAATIVETSREAVDVLFFCFSPSTLHSLKVLAYRDCKQEMVDFFFMVTVTDTCHTFGRVKKQFLGFCVYIHLD